MNYRPGQASDFINVETFVWQAIFPAFDHPDLNEAQRAENDALVAEAKDHCLQAIALEDRQVFVARDPQQRRLAGFIILDRAPRDYPEIVWLIVSRKYWGQGVADGLMRAGIEWLGTERPIKLKVHFYLDRAKAFFARYGFEDSGEPAGDHLIPRILFLREAGPLSSPGDAQLELPIMPPEAEIATSSVTEIQNPLEPDSPADPVPPPTVLPPTQTNSTEPAVTEGTYRSRYQDIELEIEDHTAVSDPGPPADQTSTMSGGIGFEFAFDDEDDNNDDNDRENEADKPDHEAIEEAEILDLPELEPDPELESEPAAEPGAAAPPLSELRGRFQEVFVQEVTDLFGERALPLYLEKLKGSAFPAVVDNGLSLLRQSEKWEEELPGLAAELTEYFIVETAAELHGGVFPQRLLRHRDTPAGADTLFALINDYLDLEQENERVDTDFITIAPGRLRNATRNFLFAGPGERVFFLVDQSLLGNLKNGFAITDRAIYWKALLQPNHVAYYPELNSVRLEKGAVVINGHFFDTGKRNFNLKVALLLKRLGRLVTPKD